MEQAAEATGMSNVFVGITLVAIVGNAAEHSTAVLVATKNRMDLSFGIAIGSSTHITNQNMPDPDPELERCGRS